MIYINNLLMFRIFKKKIMKIKQILNNKFLISDFKLCWYYLDIKII